MTNVTFVCLNAYKMFDPSSKASMGGTELQMHAIAQKLAHNPEYAVSFIVGDFGQEKVMQFGSIRVYRSFPLDKTWRVFLQAPFLLWSILRRIHPDVIISSPAGPEVGLLALYAKLKGIHYLFRTASDIDCTGEKERAMGMFSGMLYRIGIHLADMIITQHTTQQYALKRCYRKNSIIINNGFAIPESISPKKYGKKSIIWIGSARRVKRPDILFTIAKHFPQYEFVMILSHSGDPALFTECEATAKEIPNLRFLGELPPEETNEQLQQSFLLLGTSDYEGSPNTYIAAMAYGIPIISLHVPCEGMCAHGDMNALYKGIDMHMQDTAQCQNTAARERAYVLQHHSMKAVIQDWTSAIRTTCYS